MSKAEILDELPRLSAADRTEVLARLWALEEAAEPTDAEKALLDRAQSDYDADPTPGTPWREVEARLRRRP